MREKSDTYPEIPWKAFAFGVAVAATLLVLHLLMAGQWSTQWPVLYMAFLLGSGAAAAALTLFWTGYARLFLDRVRAEGEVEQYAKDLFLEREVFKTQARTGLLIMISLFEHRVVILPDTGFRDLLSRESLEKVIGQMSALLRKGDCFLSLAQGLKVIEAVLLEAGFKGTVGAPDQIPDEILQLKGADK